MRGYEHSHPLCVEFVNGAGIAPRQTAGAGGPADAGLDGAAPLGEVRYDELWPGIDLVYSGARGLAKATYHVAPGADPGRIRLRYSVPVTMTIHYSDADVAGIDENTLRVVYWTGSAWADMALTCPSSEPYVRDPSGNVIRLAFCHMSEGALVGN